MLNHAVKFFWLNSSCNQGHEIMFTFFNKKPIHEKLKRMMKYWRVRYQQTNERERLTLYLLVFLVLSYAWWVLIVF
jgi:hypothetical protein